MKAAFVTRFGPPETLQLRDVAKPSPAEGQILIAVKAIGLNFADVMSRLGVYPGVPKPPFIAGLEFSGVVEHVGKNVTSFKRGDRVLAFTRQGAYAEYVCVDANHAQPVPKKMSFEVAAALGVTYLTAYHGLITLAKIQKGERLLLHAAAGGVGTAAIQIARHLGVEIFGTASSAQKLDVAHQQGMHHGFNYQTEDFERGIRQRTQGKGIDVVMDSVGGMVFRKSWRLLAPMGRYVLYGFAAVTGRRGINRLRAIKEIVSTPLIYPPNIVSKNLGLFGFNLYFLFDEVEYFRKASRQLMKWYDQAIIKPVVGARYTFDRIAEAQELLQSRKSYGKIVVNV
ncbi:MAG: zinc-binding dehydrogenase [Ignavibacteriales bacterium]|nr:zinc-binding dehydrogenase [Ignavibacteriales bacterium]